MMNVKIEFSYDGRDYYGVQKQKNRPTIQEEIENALLKLFNVQIDLIYAGRTDKGVSAECMVGNFFVETTICPEKICYALNQYLPDNIRILKSEQVDENFNSRYDAKKKTYKYSLYESKFHLPLFPFQTQFKSSLKYLEMKKAIKYFVGTKDFTSVVTSSCEIENKVRTIYKAKIVKEKTGDVVHYHFYFTGNGFLYNQVRIMVGTLVLVGLGKIKPRDVKKILLLKDRSKSGSVMSAEGLSLLNVEY